MIFSIDEKNNSQTALFTADREISYGELSETVRRFGVSIRGRNLVFCLCRNCVAAVAGYLGILDQGSVPLLLDAHLEWQQLAGLYESYRPEMLWMPREKLPEYRQAGENTNWCSTHEILYEYEGYVLIEVKTPAPGTEMHRQLALLLTTSGSTGSPRLVRLSRENIRSNAAAIVEYLNIIETERAITTLPMHYTYGLSVLHSHLLAGAGIILTEKSVVQEEFWQLVSRRRATSLSGVPYTCQMLDRLGLFRGPKGTLKTITQAGGKLPEALQAKIARWSREQQVHFYIMYGQTEATARMGYLPEAACLDKPGSLGIAIPGGRFWLEDEKHQPVREPYTTGELCYQGPNVSLGYAQCRADLALGDERGGILATGDLAQFDEEGYYYIVGRKSRFVKLYGHRISLDACEKMLEDMPREPGAAEFACTGNDVRILVVTTEKTLAEPAGAWLARQLNLPERAVRGVWLSGIPRNSRGKINYSEMEAQADGAAGN